MAGHGLVLHASNNRWVLFGGGRSAMTWRPGVGTLGAPGGGTPDARGAGRAVASLQVNAVVAMATWGCWVDMEAVVDA